MFLLFLMQPVNEALDNPHTDLYRTLIIGTVAVYSLSYLTALWFGPHPNHQVRIVTVAWLFVIGGTLPTIMRDPGGMTYLTYAIAASVMLLPLRASRILGLGVILLQAVLMWAINGSVDWGNTWVLFMVTVGMSSFFALSVTVHQLRQSRDENARLAVAEERSRLARDLHDVLGHSLTTITVKAGLARRVLESATDPDRAAEEIREVEQLARQALTEVRATVSGYREASLPAEIAGARAALRAAEITADLPHAVDNVSGELQQVFAYVLREGVTNVLRHSKATRCEVRFGGDWLEIKDNGRGGESTVDGNRGNGLTGLSERLEKVGGVLESGPLPGGGFRVRASVPAADEKSATAPAPGTASSVRLA